jgi:hypothetical protein
LLVRGQVLFGGWIAQAGWLFLAVGMIFLWAFLPEVNVISHLQFLGRLEKANGVVVSTDKTNATVNKSPVYAIHYTFATADGIEYQGVSYATGWKASKRDQVVVEYVRANPGRSRIQGMRTTQLGPWMSFILLFPIAGALMVVITLRRGIKAACLLTHGKQAQGKLKSKVKTNMEVNNRPVFKLTFEFVAEDGYPYEATVKSHMPDILEDEAEEPLVYDADDPRNAVMLDDLPGAPRIDDAGNIRTSSVAKALVSPLLPVATVVGHSTYAFLRFLQ